MINRLKEDFMKIQDSQKIDNVILVKNILRIIDVLDYVMVTAKDIKEMTSKDEELFICNNILYYTNDLLYSDDYIKRIKLFVSEIMNAYSVLNYFYDGHTIRSDGLKIDLELAKYLLLDKLGVLKLNNTQKMYIDRYYNIIFECEKYLPKFSSIFQEKFTEFSARKLGVTLENLINNRVNNKFEIICQGDGYIKFKVYLINVHSSYFNGEILFDTLGEVYGYVFYYDIKTRALIPNMSNRIDRIKEVEKIYESLIIE